MPSVKVRNPEEDKEIQFDNEMFSVSTDWSYLYIFGKQFIKNGLDLKSGVLALADCIELIKFLGLDYLSAYSKARYWIAYALFVSGYKK